MRKLIENDDFVFPEFEDSMALIPEKLRCQVAAVSYEPLYPQEEIVIVLSFRWQT